VLEGRREREVEEEVEEEEEGEEEGSHETVIIYCTFTHIK